MASRNVAKPRFESIRIDDRPNRLKAVERVASENLGFKLSPWQKRAVRTATQHYEGSDKPYYRNAIITVPRQAGKSWLMYVVMTELALRNPYSMIKFSAQTRMNAASRVMDLGDLLIRYDNKVKVTRGIGNERIVFANGSRIEVLAPTEKAGHGDSLDLVVLDELWGIQEHTMQSIIPSMAARPNAQFWAISTQGTPDSELLLRLCKVGREAVETGREDEYYYLDYSADPEEDDPFAEATWRKVHPALGLTVGIEAIRSAMEVLPPNEFRRAYANILVDGIDNVFEWEAWQACYMPVAKAPEQVPVLAVDLGRNPQSASIAVGWPTESEGTHTELVAYRSGSPSWVVAEVKRLVSERAISFVAIDDYGPAGVLGSELEGAFEYDPRVTVIKPRGTDLAPVCSHYFNGVATKTITHGRADPLDDAIRGLVLKNVGDNYVWHRRQSRNDLSPLWASSIAAWVVNEQRVAPKPQLAIY